MTGFEFGPSVAKRLSRSIVPGAMYFDFTNVLNHMQPADPCYTPWDTTTWGVLGCGGNVQANTPRRLQLGISIDF